MALIQGLSYQVVKSFAFIKQNIHILETDNILVFFFTECSISEPRATQLKEWLRNNSRPLSQVETYMSDTAVYRGKGIRENSWTINQILDEFPHLMTKGMVSVGKYDLTCDQNVMFLMFY